MRVDGGIKGRSLLAKNMKACAIVGRGEKSLLISDPGSKLRLRREIEKERSTKKIDVTSKKNKKRHKGASVEHGCRCITAAVLLCTVFFVAARLSGCL